jgi:hypothetical protein
MGVIMGRPDWNQRTVTLRALVNWLAGTVVVIATATYTITHYIGQQNTTTYKTQLKFKEDEIIKIEKKVKLLGTENNRLKQSPERSPVKDVLISISTKEPPSKLKHMSYKDLITLTEKSNNILKHATNELGKRSINKLNPRSELAMLLKQLKSGNDNQKKLAICSLFKLHDPLSFEPLAEFFLNNHNNLYSKSNVIFLSWCLFLIELNESLGLELVVNQLENEDTYRIECIFSVFERYTSSSISDVEVIRRINILRPLLIRLALTSENSTTRTNAKVIIKNMGNREKKAQIRINDTTGGAKITITYPLWGI